MLEGPRPLHGFFREVWTPRHTDHSGASTWAPRYRHEDDCSYCYRSLLLFSTEGCWTSRVCSGNASGYLAIHIAVDCILVQQNHCVDPTYKTFAASQIHRLLSNWYVTAGDIAAMSEVQYMFSASPAYVHMSLGSLCSSIVIVCIDGMREYS